MPRSFCARAAGLSVAVAVAALAVLAAGPTARAQDKIVLRGAGATFPAPLYEKWIQVYRRDHPEIAISYGAVGSSEGQKRFLADAVDFGASDAALTDEQLERVKTGARLVPATAGIVVLAYNLPGVTAPLRLPARCTSTSSPGASGIGTTRESAPPIPASPCRAGAWR